MKILSIVETAYRATLEEQDDTVLWLNHSLKNSGADISLLLRGNAVNYALRGHDASGLAIGERKLVRGPAPDKDLEKLISAKVPVYVVEEDLAKRGLPDDGIIGGLSKVSRRAIPELFERFDQVWHW
ncbi:MAG: DsrE family protein [Betaproteobacteria bacterium]|nr:DsrE family protein [Betaproteobacteria bacterium]